MLNSAVGIVAAGGGVIEPQLANSSPIASNQTDSFTLRRGRKSGMWFNVNLFHE
jgi:hypothetical protein